MGAFSIIPNWVIRETDLTGTELLVYIALLNRADRYGRCFPAMRTLAKESRCSERTVRRTLVELGRKHLVRIERRPQPDGTYLSNVYRIAIFDRSAPAEGDPGTTPGGPWQIAPVHPGNEQEEVDTPEVDTEEEDVRSDRADRTRTGSSFSDNDGSASPKQRS